MVFIDEPASLILTLSMNSYNMCQQFLISGCRAIGITGSDEKCAWLKEELGFDEAINYKRSNLRPSLKRAAPNGIDCYFDNVGGKISWSVMSLMNMYGRVAVCGSISSYNDTAENQTLDPPMQPLLVMNQLCVEGFFVWRWLGEVFLCSIYHGLK